MSLTIGQQPQEHPIPGTQDRPVASSLPINPTIHGTVTLALSIQPPNQAASSYGPKLAAVALIADQLRKWGAFVPFGNDTTANGPPAVRTIIVRLAPTAGNKASLTASIDSNGALRSIAITAAGSQYAAPPILRFDVSGSPNLQQMPQANCTLTVVSTSVDEGGVGYSATPVVTTVGGVGVGGRAPKLHATVMGGVIQTIVVDDPGVLISIPTIVITDSTGTGAMASVSLGIGAVTIINKGLGLDVAPPMGAVPLYAKLFPFDQDPWKDFMVGRISTQLATPCTAATPVFGAP